MVVWSVNRNVLFHVFAKLCHECIEIRLTADFTEVFGGEVRVHTGTVPVTADRFAVILDVDTVFLTKAIQNVTSDPDLVSCVFGTFTEDLEFPLTFSNLSVDAFVVDTRVEAEVEVFFNDLASDVTNCFEASAAIVWALWCWIAINWEAKWLAILIHEIFLFETEPCIWIVQDGGAGVGWVRCAVWHHNLAHDEGAIFTGAVRINSYRFKHTIRTAARCLLS